MIAEGVARARAEERSLADAARLMVTEARAAGRRIPGFGHRVHHTDPRTGDPVRPRTRKGGVAGDGVAFIEALEPAIAEAVSPCPSTSMARWPRCCHDMGFPPAFGRLVFIIGRIAGLTAEVAEELSREKPMRIRVPVEYDGVAPRPIE